MCDETEAPSCFCQVSRYDETYRDCGLLDQMGGLGAHSDTDYVTWPTGVLVTDFLKGRVRNHGHLVQTANRFPDYKEIGNIK